MVNLSSGRSSLLIALSLLISACATQTSKLENHSNAVAGIQQWHIRGKIGIRSATESLSAMLNWQQLSGAYTIRLSGALGSGSLQIIGHDGGVTVRQAGATDLHARDAATLLHQRLGWAVPVAHIYFWIRGLPAAAVPVDRQTSSDGRLSVLEQDGWRVEFLRYEYFDNFALPSKLRLQHADLQVTLIIKDWQIKQRT